MQLVSLDVTALQVTDCCDGPRHQRRRQGGRKNKTGCMAANIIDQGSGAGDIASHDTERLGERALDHGRTARYTVSLGDAGAARAVEPDRMHLVEVGHRPNASATSHNSAIGAMSPSIE